MAASSPEGEPAEERMTNPSPLHTQDIEDLEDPEDVLASGMFSLYTELPPLISIPARAKHFTHRGVTVSTANTNNWQLQAHGIWRSSIHLINRFQAILDDYLPQCDPTFLSGLDVLELGASSGLPGLCFANQFSPRSMTLSDYPDAAIAAVERENITLNPHISQYTIMKVVPHKWGDPASLFRPSTDKRSQEPIRKEPEALDQYDIIIAADILWLPDEHDNLVQTLIQSLKPSRSSFISIVAGLHTGRPPIEQFLDAARKGGLELRRFIEAKAPLDVDEEQFPEFREWESMREGETPTDRGLWLVYPEALIVSI
ncbi:hypothetical protein DL93DRAFT_1038209 [Clavulina sp. PMI_390]|nr:hypothetical protein DL93DRAFT_1038209 [Clavulina sp. PMI_390]